MSLTVAPDWDPMEPFLFWPWLLESDMHYKERVGYSVQLLPAIRQRFPGCVSDQVAAVRLIARWPEAPKTAWALVITEFHPEQMRLMERHVEDITPITQEDGDNYDYSDHPSAEFPRDVIAALLRPGIDVIFGNTLGIFRQESMRMLINLSFAVEYSVESQDRTESDKETARLLCHAHHYRNWTLLSAEELCRNVDLAAEAIERLRTCSARGIGGGEESSLWEEILSEVRAESLFNESMKSEVLQAVYDAFRDLPLATQWAYWLLNGCGMYEMEPGKDWKETSDDPKDWTMYELETCLEKAVRKVWGKADDEAYKDL
jgi:hypothetical protein